MSPWNGERFPKYTPKKPPPQHGIKATKLGTTWWGQRWIEALEHVLGGDAGRLARGRSYARAGRTHDFVVQAGKVKAQVTGSRATPYEVELALTQLSDAAWQRAIEAMAQKAEFSAKLLAGEMPQPIDELFRSAKTNLFPAERAELKTSCSCPDWGDPCKHVAAVHYVLGEALDRDPFLLFELRGRTKPEVLGLLRAARGQNAEEQDARVATVPLGKLSARDYEAASEPLPSLSFSFEAPGAQAAVLRQLGAPPTWRSDQAPVDSLAPLLRQAAETARRIALAEAPPDPQPAANSIHKPRKPRQSKRRGA